jgi:hypothetical protein
VIAKVHVGKAGDRGDVSAVLQGYNRTSFGSVVERDPNYRRRTCSFREYQTAPHRGAKRWISTQAFETKRSNRRVVASPSGFERRDKVNAPAHFGRERRGNGDSIDRIGRGKFAPWLPADKRGNRWGKLREWDSRLEMTTR